MENVTWKSWAILLMGAIIGRAGFEALLILAIGAMVGFVACARVATDAVKEAESKPCQHCEIVKHEMHGE